jgi:ectoine hydroxylase-related dioxygenase (phytanoyl-CoA dioxygenase family)
VRESLEKDGFAVIPNLISNDKVVKCLDFIKSSINKAAAEVKVTTKDYLSCTGRWATSSPITVETSEILDAAIKSYFEQKLTAKLLLKKSNVICKTAAITDPVPFHQDISYSPNDPYHFSVWLSLNDVDINSAPIQVVRNSHHNKIEPAVDFWDPYFVDTYNNSKDIKSITVNAGDAIVFDSKLFHGSDKNCSNKDRFAYVTRWSIEGRNFPKIPKIKTSNFGMFNCGELTNKKLNNSLKLFNQDSHIIKNKEALRMLWIDILNKKDNNIREVNNSLAIKDLRKLDILNKACDLHDAGNISGLVYKNLWFSLLSSLNSKIQLVKD